MLYETLNVLKESFGPDYFTSRVDDGIAQNLNPKFELREYQKEALGRFDFYFSEYQKRQWPAHLLFHMATGSGKTLIMAANILYLYRLGYRNFIFFVNSTNIIEKTKDNFLNSLSEKYLFAPKIKFGDLPAEASAQAGIAKTKIKYKFVDFGENIIRGALDKFEFYRFDNLKKYFPHLKSVYEFISSPNYLGTGC